MTRVIRLIVPVSLCGLITGALVLACSHHKEAPATPGPEATSPSRQPAPSPPPGGEPAPPQPSDVGNTRADAGVDGYPPHGGSQSALDRGLGGAGAATVQLASQPVTPQGPTGAPPTPGAPAPNPPTPSPGAPSPSPGTPPTGTPPSPGVPPSPTGPSQPGAPTPPPGTPQAPRAPTQTPSDAGVGDALTPPVPSISDAGVRIDSGLSPVLQRDY